MLHDYPVPVDACGVVEVSCEDKIGGVWLCLDCYVGAFAIEFHEDDVEVAGICGVYTLLDPCIQHFDGARKQLMEREISIAFAFCIEQWKTLSGNDVALERTDLTLVQELLAHSVLATDIGT